MEYVEAVASKQDDASLAARIQTARVRLGLSDSLDLLQPMNPHARLAALLSIADGRSEPWPEIREAAASVVGRLSSREHESVVALAVWAGLDAESSGFMALPSIYKSKAAMRLARTAAFPNANELMGWIREHVPAGPGRDAALSAAVDARIPRTSGGRTILTATSTLQQAQQAQLWVSAAAHIDDPLMRAQTLLRIAPHCRTESHNNGAMRPSQQMAFTLAQAAYERLQAKSGQQRWRGAAATLFGGVAALLDPHLASRLLVEGWEQLHGVEGLMGRAEALRMLVAAEALRGGQPWCDAVTAFGTDQRLKAEPTYWAHLARDLPTTLAFVEFDEDGAKLADCLKSLWLVLSKIRFPQHRAVGFARYADVAANRDSSDPSAAIQQVSSALRSTQDPRRRSEIWAEVAVACARATPEVARNLTKLGRDPYEKVRWLLCLADVAVAAPR